MVAKSNYPRILKLNDKHFKCKTSFRIVLVGVYQTKYNTIKLGKQLFPQPRKTDKLPISGRRRRVLYPYGLIEKFLN